MELLATTYNHPFLLPSGPLEEARMETDLLQMGVDGNDVDVGVVESEVLVVMFVGDVLFSVDGDEVDGVVKVLKVGIAADVAVFAVVAVVAVVVDVADGIVFFFVSGVIFLLSCSVGFVGLGSFHVDCLVTVLT